jgi:ATP-binding cassette subfamily B protein
VEHKKFAVKSYTLGISLQESTIPLGVISLIVTLYFTKTSNIQISDLGIIVWSLKNVASSASILLSSKTNVETIFPSFEQLQSIEKKAQSFELKNGSLKFEKLEQGISIEQVVFAYPARDQVLRNVTLFIPKHKMIALVGKSGSGKSTLVDLILGFQLPDSGQINFDNTDLRLLDIASLRDKMGYVPQDPVLFNMTIRENLLWSNPHASNEDLWLACEMAYATEFIKNLPLGLDTNIGDKGVKFSGGQKQRLALARAIIRKPELLILDEATSALDSESEKSIQKAIETISKNTTTIIIAHRLSTIQNADCIYFIHEGKILESGTYQELSSSNSKFKEKFLI